MKVWTQLAARATFLGMTALVWQLGAQGQPGRYSGPSILSRNSRLPRGQGRAPVNLKAYLQVGYSYMDGLTPVGTTREGQVPKDSSDAGYLGGGVYATHVDSRSQFNIDYTANYTHTRNATYYNGLNQGLGLSYQRQLTRKWGFQTDQRAGTQATVLGLERTPLAQGVFNEPFLSYNEPLDARLYYLQSTAGFYYQHSPRLVFSMDGGVFTVRRHSQSLASSRGEMAQGEIAYRLNRDQHVGVVYSYNHFYFLRSFGESHVHSVMGSYGRRLGRFWSFQAMAGPYRVESDRVVSVAVDPFISALTGDFTTLQVFHGVRRGMGASVGLAGNFRRQGVNFGYDRMVNTGNGLTLTAQGETAYASYGYNGFRRLSLGAGATWSRLTPLLESQTSIGEFHSAGVSGNLAYRLTNYLHFTASAQYLRVDYQSIGFGRTRRAVFAGLALSPGEVPLRLRR